jgi:hypothetical protein
MEINPINKRRFNLVGVIPVDGQPLDFKFPWHDSLISIGHNYLAVEKAVFDCAMAGCDTIWLTCPKDMQPLIRERLGDYIVDPHVYYTTSKFANYPTVKEIPIYYVPSHPKDVGRRTSLSWSVITGAHNAWRVSRKISRWVTPDKYFVSFPYGMFTSYYMGDHRAKIRSEQPFCLSYEGKSYKDGLFLPFTFGTQDYINVRKKFRSNEVRGCDKNMNYIKREDAYTGRFFAHDFIFGEIQDNNLCSVELPWYYDVSSWEGLKSWLASDYSLDKPKDFILSYSEFNKLGEELDEKE